MKRQSKKALLLRYFTDVDFEPDENYFDFSQLYNFNTPETIVQLGKITNDMAENNIKRN